jgi:hypothetical protein
MNVLGKEIPRASEALIESLIKIGIIYVGEDDQLHVIERIENTEE